MYRFATNDLLYDKSFWELVRIDLFLNYVKAAVRSIIWVKTTDSLFIYVRYYWNTVSQRFDLS